MRTFEERMKSADARLRIDVNFDIVKKEFLYGGRVPAVLYAVSGLTDGEQLSKTLGYMMRDAAGAGRFSRGEGACPLFLPCAEVGAFSGEERAFAALLSGSAMLIVSGVDGYLTLDEKKLPSRSIGEPVKEKVLRGARDGFTEALLPNAALIRRRIRDERLIFLRLTAGKSSKTDVVLSFIEGKADGAYVERLKNAIAALDPDALNMGEESLAELLVKKKRFDPFPKVRYTERPDAAAAMLMEGSVILLCDNYPAAMILPTAFFDFLQATDDFCFTPLIGGYLKLVRNAVFAASLLLTPLWYALQSAPELLRGRFSFLLYEGNSFLPLLLQLLLVEVCIDGLKLASLNTPDTLSNSLGVISALILGDLAVGVGWLSQQVILYMAFVAIANFTQPSYEMGYAFKFTRILTLLLIARFSFRGLFLGCAATVALIALNGSVFSPKGYLYPLIPFDGRALFRLFFRVRAGRRSR